MADPQQMTDAELYLEAMLNIHKQAEPLLEEMLRRLTDLRRERDEAVRLLRVFVESDNQDEIAWADEHANQLLATLDRKGDDQ